MRVLHAAADLMLGTRCVGCGRAGSVACGDCRASLTHQHLVHWVPEADLVVVAASWYQGATVHLLRAHKDAGAWDLAGVLASAIAVSVQDVARLWPGGFDPPLILVPVPSWPHRIRERGYDHAASVARLAAKRLDGTWSRSLLRRSGHGRQQAGLARAERAANRGATLRVRSGTGTVVLVDDIVTTGATAQEAAAALRSAGWQVLGVAAVAVTPLRHTRRLNTPAAPRSSHPGQVASRKMSEIG